MGSITLNASSTGVTTGANTTGIFSDIFTMKVQPGTNLRFLSGTPLRMKLHDGSDNELPNTSEILIGYRKPGQKQLTELAKMSYQPFGNITPANQYDKDTEARRKMYFNADKVPKGVLRLTEDVQFVIQLKSTVAMSWSAAGTFAEVDCEEIVK